MSITINNVDVNEGFSGSVSLGAVDSLFVSGDGAEYSLYGTVFKESTEVIITPPSEDYKLTSGTIETSISSLLKRRITATTELARLEKVKSDVIDGKYDYGVSSELIDVLNFLSTNAIKPLPSMIVGGKLGYEDLIKNNEDAEPFKDSWEKWSHVFPGLKRYEEPVDDESIPGDSINTEENPAML